MKIYKKLTVLLSILIIFILSLTACKNNNNIKKVRLNEVVHSVFYTPQYVAMEKGFFADEGIEIELSVGNGADKSMTALLSNSADISLLGTEAGIYVYNEGKKDYPKIFGQLTQRAGNFLISRENNLNFDWNDLKEKSIIGGRAGGMPQLVLEYVLKNKNLKIGEDLDIINNISFESTAGAFQGGIGDFTVEFEPTATSLENNKSGYVVASLGEESGYIPYTVYMATDEYIKNNKEIIQKFINAIYKGQQWVNSHTPKEIAEIIHPHFKEFDIDTLSKIIERYKNQDTWNINPLVDEKGFNIIQDIMQEGGELEKRVPYNDIVINDFANKIIQK